MVPVLRSLAWMALLGMWFFVTLSPWALLPWATCVWMWVLGRERCSLGWGKRLVAFVVLNSVVKYHHVWNFLYEFPTQCENPVQSANNTGLQVFIAAPGKMGTRTMSHALNQLGLRSYHSEDFNMMPFWGFMLKEWERRGTSEWRLTMGEAVATLPAAGRELLAHEIAKCRVEALALDGAERLAVPVLAVSPDVKVLVMQWRGFDAWKVSSQNFMPIVMMMVFYGYYNCQSLAFLPWAALIRVLDPLFGGRVEQMLRDGAPVTEGAGPLQYLYFDIVAYRRHMMSWHPTPTTPLGTGLIFETEEEYNSWFEEIRQMIPPANRMECDPRKTTFEDLCEFLQISPCPSSGRLPRTQNSFALTRDFPFAASVAACIGLVFHFVNWRLFNAIQLRVSQRVSGTPSEFAGTAVRAKAAKDD